MQSTVGNVDHLCALQARQEGMRVPIWRHRFLALTLVFLSVQMW